LPTLYFFLFLRYNICAKKAHKQKNDYGVEAIVIGIEFSSDKIIAGIPIEGIEIRREMLFVKGFRSDGFYDYEVIPMTEANEDIAQKILSDPDREFVKVKCGDSRMEEWGILLACLLYNAKGPAHTIAGGVGVPSRLIAGLKGLEKEPATGLLDDLEIVARSSWLNYKKFLDIFNCTGTIYYEHSDCHGWSGIDFSGPEQEKDMHLQAAIVLTMQKREIFDGIDESFIVYVEFKGRQPIAIDIYHIIFG